MRPLVGLNCVRCQRTIHSILEGRFCEICGNPRRRSVEPPGLLRYRTMSWYPTSATFPSSNLTARCPAPGDESALLHWVHRQRERRVARADMARLVTCAGHEVGENALRRRYCRWWKKDPPEEPDKGRPA